jgi:AcrR family transcriptional regulator
MTQTDQSEQNEESLVEAAAGDEPVLSLDDDPADLADHGDHGDPAATPDAAAHHNDTRQRILDVALDLFTEQGFDATSLRQIAERLGVTKAAIYYYFESKDDILLALHMRIHEFGKNAFLSMGDEPVTLEQWGELVDEIAVQMLPQRKLFAMHERNQAALEKLHNEAHDSEHEDIQNKLRQVLADPRVPLENRVRMAASVGVVFSGLFLAGPAFDSESDEELGSQLRAVIHNVLFG